MNIDSERHMGLVFGLAFSLLLVITTLSLAQTDITAKVQLASSGLTYDRRALTSSLNVSLNNISQEAFLTPIQVVMDILNDSTVKVTNADGVTSEGKPYFTYTTQNGQFPSGGSIAARKWVFSNPKAARLSYTCAVYASGARIAVTLPSSISPSSIAIQTPEGSFTLNPDGTFTMATQLPGPFLVAARVQGTPVALSLYNPGEPSNAISCVETAVSLVMLSNMLFTVPTQLIPDALALIRSVTEVQTLGIVICQKLSERTNALVSPDPALTTAMSNAANAVNTALKALR